MSDPDAARNLEVLQRRARHLARKPAPVADQAPRTLLRFDVDDRPFAVAAERVLEVTRVERLMPLPGATHGWIAVAVWRGHVVGVKDLHASTARALGAAHSMLIVLDAPLPFALYATAVRGLVEVPESALHRPEAGQDVYGAWAEAVTTDAVIIVSVERMLDQEPGRRHA